ncbi:MAG: hypothetical protein EP334_08795 [Gammaproteobacteria bacterium]|nr:MAG: hypothetical protein EP334_08795 [Gammaproteobacteria bacterium]
MYSDENYLWGIIGYYLGCALVLLFLWRFRELLPGRHFRNHLILLIAAVILVPIKAYPDMNYLAPAWFVSLFEGLTGTTEMGFLRGAQPIIVSYLAAVTLYLLAVLLGFIKRRGDSDDEASVYETSGGPEES